MAFSLQQFTSTGVEDHIILAFPYLDRGDVHLYGGAAEVPFTWASSTRIDFTPFPAGTEVVVRRLTDRAKLVYTLSEGAPFTRNILDQIHAQALYLAQESVEGAFFDIYGDVDMHGFRLRNAGAPELPADYTTKLWVEAAILGAELGDSVLAGQLLQMTRETIRRAYAEAGLTLVSGSFSKGATLTATTDVLLDESTGIAYAYTGTLPVDVAAGTTPSAAWVSKAGYTLAARLADPSSTALIGGTTAGRVGDAANGRYGPVRLQQGRASNLLIRDVTPGNPTRVHQEPNGRIISGTVTKYDWMFDPYQDDAINYRILNVYTETGDIPSQRGSNGRALVNVKGTGQQWGVWPSLDFGFQDGAQVPMKLFYFDTSDTAWRTPQRGMWYSGTTYNTGDYVLSAFKLYRAVTAGVSGGLPPVHTSGAVSDGVVTWEFIRNYQAAVNSVEACVLFGSVTDMPLFGHPGIRVQFHGHTLHKNGFRQKWLDNTNTLLAWTGVPIGSDSYAVEMSDGSGTQVFRGWRRANKSALALGNQVVSDNSSTVDVSTKEKITFSNTVATTVVGLSNARGNQSIYIEATNSNTTIAHNTQIRLKGGANLNLTPEMILHLVQHSDGRFIQV